MNPKLIVIDGRTYHSIDEMPSDIRQKYEQACVWDNTTRSRMLERFL
jgi:hypothetical protein